MSRLLVATTLLSCSICTSYAADLPPSHSAGILDVKEGYCWAGQPSAPTIFRGKVQCWSQIFFSRYSDKKIYVCTAVINGTVNTSPPPIFTLPDQIYCYPLGNPPVSGEYSFKALGSLLSRIVPQTAKEEFVTYAWRPATWIGSKTSDELAFCTFADNGGGSTKWECVTKVDWNNYVGSAVGPMD
jgi:hypothetical protein